MQFLLKQLENKHIFTIFIKEGAPLNFLINDTFMAIFFINGTKNQGAINGENFMKNDPFVENLQT